MSIRRLLIVLASLSLGVAHAEKLPGLSFAHKDWQLVCDNTRTCRAAGYSPDGAEHSVSVLLTRKAGPNQPATGQLMLGYYGDEQREVLSKLPQSLKLTMRINGRSVGQTIVEQSSLVSELSAEQVAALLASLARSSEIEWVLGNRRWQLPDQGATAALLKMDEFQGRIGTTGALIKKGSRSEDKVLPPLSVPEVIAAPLAKPHPDDRQLASKRSEALRAVLRATIKEEDNCPDLLEGQAKLSILRLTDTKLLVYASCQHARYNVGYGYWVVNDMPPYRPVLVTTLGDDARESDDGVISSSLKGRGLGDCRDSEDWTWDGKQFVHTRAASTGMCRLIAPGGAWVLPSIVTNVRPAPN